MPLFEYRCSQCDSQFELLIRGDMVPTCPACGNTSLEKVLSLFAVTSEGTQYRNRQRYSEASRAKAGETRKERDFYRHDHHDD